MSGTRKLEKFELDALAGESGTQRLQDRGSDAARPIRTPVAEPSPAMLHAARPSCAPGKPEERVEGPPSQGGARAGDREPGVEQLRTRLARKFTTLADEVTEAFGDFRIGAGWWTVELTAPEGMSTSGGKRALQHLRLRPKREGHTVLVGGVVNPVAQTAELRDHDYMDVLFRARFGRTLEITPAEWEQFLRRAELVLRRENIHTTRVPAPRDVTALAARPAHASASWRLTLARLALGLIAFLAAIVVWRVIVALAS